MDIQGIDGVGCISLAADDDVLTMRFCDLGEREMAFVGAVCIECRLEVCTANHVSFQKGFLPGREDLPQVQLGPESCACGCKATGIEVGGQVQTPSEENERSAGDWRTRRSGRKHRGQICNAIENVAQAGTTQPRLVAEDMPGLDGGQVALHGTCAD